MKKTTRKLLATLLTFAMLFGSSMTVFADEIECKNLNVNDVLTEGDSIILSQEVKDDRYAKYLRHSIIIQGTSSGNNNDSGRYSGDDFKLTVSVPTGKQWTIDNKSLSPFPDETFRPYKYIITVHETDAVPSTNPTTPSSNPVEEPTKVEEVHEHSYSWVTVQDATAEQDGIEEYRCSCGAVAERSIIPASQVFVKGLFGEIKNAPLNGTVTYDTGSLYTMSDYIIKKLAERSDVTTVVTFEYERKPYKMTIPAGVDYSAILADDDYFYGYFYFAKITGSTIEEVN